MVFYKLDFNTGAPIGEGGQRRRDGFAESEFWRHHTPDIGLFQPAEWCVLEYAAPDRSRGYAGVFKLTGGRSEYRFRSRGVDGSAAYQVALDNHRQVLRLSGQDLMLRGIPVELDAALTSELIMYEKA